MAAVMGPRREVEDSIRIARGYIKKHNRANKKKINLPEIKDNEVHRKFPDIKKMILKNVAKIKKGKKEKPRENIKIYSVYLHKKDAAGG